MDKRIFLSVSTLLVSPSWFISRTKLNAFLRLTVLLILLLYSAPLLAKGITFENVTLTCAKRDYRTAIVLDDVTGVTFTSIEVNEPGSKKEPVYSYKSSEVIFK
jgi:hypothetical protein